MIVDYAQKKFQYHNRTTKNDNDISSRYFYYLDDSEVDRMRPQRMGRALPGIQGVRCIRSIGSEGFVEFRNLSCYCDPCLNKNYKDCTNKAFVKEFVLQHVRPER